ncbi:hypothetical protein [Nonomuraea sp. NPDC003214]
MISLLQELSKKAAERWAAIVLGPGLIFVACVVVGHHQGFGHALSIGHVRTLVPAGLLKDPAWLASMSAVLTLGAVVAGLTATAAGRYVERLWMPGGPQWYVRLLTALRARRWDRLNGRLRAAVTEAGRVMARDRLLGVDDSRRFPAAHRLRARLDRLGETRPGEATWSAQRMADVTRHVHRRYGLDLALVWPHLWVLTDSDVRKELQNVVNGYAAAARLSVWGAAYLLVFAATGWWPAGIAGVVLLVIAWRRGRSAVSTLAPVLESVVDLHVRALAERLGVPQDGPFRKETADGVHAVLRQ